MVEMRRKRGGTRDKEEVENEVGEKVSVGRRGCPKYLVAAHLLMAHLT